MSNTPTTSAPTAAAMLDALERIALLDEADGHELTWEHASHAVAIATSTLGKHPSQIHAERQGTADGMVFRRPTQSTREQGGMTDDLELPIVRASHMEIVLRVDHDRIVKELNDRIEQLQNPAQSRNASPLCRTPAKGVSDGAPV